MPAQGNALGTGSRNKNRPALKGHNKRVDKNIVSPFQGWADSHSDRIPRALPWALLFRPLRGGRKAQHQNLRFRRVDHSPASRKLTRRARSRSRKITRKDAST